MTASDFVVHPFGSGLIMVAGLLLEAMVGYPPALFKAIGHPVSWMGALLSLLERTFNKPDSSNKVQFLSGGLVLGFLLMVVGGASYFVQTLLLHLPYGIIGLCVAAATLLAGRSLYEHVATVAHALTEQGLEGGRHAISLLVGRDPAQLDEAGVARAALESLAENFSDGVVAPLFWGVVFGLPGIALYKAVNTADSMIGHRNAQYEYFGKCAARLDDVLNYIPARLAAAFLYLVALPSSHQNRIYKIVRRDAPQHLSWNAGWPEAAMAGALDVRLGGPRHYGARHVEGAWLGDGRTDVNATDIKRGLRIYVRAVCACALLFGFISAAWLGTVLLD